MPTFEHSELLPEHEILQYKIPMVTEEANQCSDPEENEAEHGTELYQINDWKYCYKLLILRSARVLAREKPLRKTELLVVFFVLSLLFVSAVSAIVFGSSSP